MQQFLNTKFEAVTYEDLHATCASLSQDSLAFNVRHSDSWLSRVQQTFFV
jgi:hypothetical protein